MKRRLMSVLILFFIITSLFIFYGCVASVEDDTVLFVEGEPVSRMEYEYHLISVMKTFEYYSTSPINWSLQIKGVSAEDYFREQAIDSVLLLRAVIINGERLDLSLTDDELGQIKASIDDEIKQSGGKRAFDKQLKNAGLNLELYEYLMTGPELYNKIFQNIYGEESTLFPDEGTVKDYYRRSYIRTRHILFFLIDEEGVPLSIGEREERLREMNEILSQLREGEDFEYLMSLHNEDTVINGASLCFTQGYMPENYYQAAISLPIGGISDVIMTNNAVCIINRLPLDNIYLIENYGPIRQECAKYSFDSLLEDWKDKLRVEFTPLYFDVDVQTLYSEYVQIKVPPGRLH